MFTHNKTDLAYQMLIEKQADIIFVSEPSQQELDAAESQNVKLIITPIAKEGFVFITHKDNPVDSLTIEQIQDIYMGKISNWSAVGGEDRQIMAYRRNVDSGSESLMANMVMKDLPMSAPTPDMLVSSMSGLISVVAEYENDSNAIGYSVYYYASEMAANPNIKFLKINGVMPTKETISNESYQLTTHYFTVIKRGNYSPNLIAFIEWLQTPEAKAVIESAGYISM
jgi:phosphate transport system substrate-binding protein